MKPMKVVAFLARIHGLAALETLLADPHFEVVAMVTHQFRPKSEDPQRGERPNYKRYASLSSFHGIPLFAVDSRSDAKQVYAAIEKLDYDVLVSISWRRLIPDSLLKKPKYGGINLHRGKLPNYPGAEPIKQALEHGDREVTISAHLMTSKIDEGPLLEEAVYSIEHLQSLPRDQEIVQIKREITPLFGPLLLNALRKRIGGH